jgi:hypothetical protein
MFRGSEKGLKEDPFKILGVPRVRLRVIKNHANEAQTRNQDKTNRDSRSYSHYQQHGCQKCKKDLARVSMKGKALPWNYDTSKATKMVFFCNLVGSILWQSDKDNEIQKVEVES